MQWNEFRSHIRHLTARQQTRVHDAFELGKKMHHGQTRRSGEPYFNHPILVAHMLADMGADTDTIVAALLHDTVEDTPLTLQEIDGVFGGTVRNLIEGVTKLSKADVADQPNLDEQIETLRKIFTLMENDVRIMVIKLVDRLHNMQTVEFLAPEKQRNLATETMEVYVKIADRLCMQDLRDELEGLCLAVLEPDVHASLSALRAHNETVGFEMLNAMRERLTEAGMPQGSLIQYEQKSWENMRGQLQAEGTVVTGVSAHTAVFICPDTDACYRMLGTLHQLWKQETLSFQDYINVATVNGYQGLHTTIIQEDGTRVRCKIRTPAMQEYARKGIATRCFGARTSSVLKLLPWAERISPLSAYTADRSQEFWQSLQSDILGESIIVHGLDDRTVQLPNGSTALDGAFFLYQEDALRVQTIRVNGKEVPFSTPLAHAVSLDATITEKSTVERSWLRWVHSGFATAKIRAALAVGMTADEKLAIGKEMLQHAMHEQRKGFIEEFSENAMQTGLRQLGYGSLEDTYIAIADGRVEAGAVCRALFDKPRKDPTRIRQCRVTYVTDMSNVEMMDRLSETHKRFRSGLMEARYTRDSASNRTSVMLRAQLTPHEQQELVSALTKAGAAEIRVRYFLAQVGGVLAAALLLVLWGLDPVFARGLLLHMSPQDLTFIRFAVFFVSAIVAYATQTYFSPRTFRPLSPLAPSLFFSGVALFLTAVFSYVALQTMPATGYILFIIAGLSVIAMLRNLFGRRSWWQSAAASMLVITAIIGILTLEQWTLFGVLAGIGSGLCFALYSLVSKGFQDEIGMVRERYPAYLFWVSSLCLTFSIGLLPFTTLSHLTSWMLIQAIGFSLVFAVLPYVLYFELMRRADNRFLDAALPFVCIVTIVGEALLVGSMTSLVVSPLMLIFLWQSFLAKKTNGS